jgi:SAM-dependent methyltransferase
MEPPKSAEGDVISAPQDALAVRRRFASHLTGNGIEIGPGHMPFPLPTSLSVRYVDRWEPTVNSTLFPELGESPGFPEPDVVTHLDLDRLSQFAGSSQDFVIASHVLEHLANPLAMLEDIHRVLRPKAHLVLLLPDRHKTFDCDRSPTPLAHLVDEYRRDVREVDDAHIIDFLIGTSTHRGDDTEAQPSSENFSEQEIELHRRRSVHVHVWNVDEFSEVLDYAADELDLRWEVVDTMAPNADGTYHNEFGWVLSKADDNTGPSKGLHRLWRGGSRRR